MRMKRQQPFTLMDLRVFGFVVGRSRKNGGAADNVSEIARALHEPYPTIRLCVVKLCRMGYLEREPDTARPTVRVKNDLYSEEIIL